MKNRTLKLASLCAGVVLVVAGCGNSPSSAGSEATSPQQAASEPEAPPQPAGTEAKATEAEATETESGGEESNQSEPGEPETDEPISGDVASPEPAVQADSCDWEEAPLAASSPMDLEGQEGDLQTVIVGAWQHTHFNTGAGYEAIEHDIRYVFPSAERLIYCQHVPGITEQAENRAEISWDGTQMVLPGDAPGYRVTEWSNTTMVWVNLMDDSLYLLQRR